MTFVQKGKGSTNTTNMWSNITEATDKCHWFFSSNKWTIRHAEPFTTRTGHSLLQSTIKRDCLNLNYMYCIIQVECLSVERSSRLHCIQILQMWRLIWKLRNLTWNCFLLEDFKERKSSAYPLPPTKNQSSICPLESNPSRIEHVA